MRLAAAFVAMTVLAGATAPASAAPPPSEGPPTAAQFQHQIDDLGVLAKLQGKDIRAADVLTPSTPLPSFLGEEGSDQQRRNLLEFAMGGLRLKAIGALAAALIPDCSTEPTPADIAAFYPFWRDAFARRQMDVVIDGVKRPYPSPAEVNAVGPDYPGAAAAAARFIHQWRLYHCVQSKYGGRAFRKYPIDLMSFGSIGAPTDKLDVEAPEPNYLTPTGSLGDLISAGRKAGLLSFPNDAYRQVFTGTYTGGRMDTCFNDVDGAVAYFTTPPWQGASFPPVEKSQAEFKTSPTGSAGFEVPNPPNWQTCVGSGSLLTFQLPKLTGLVELLVVADDMNGAQAEFRRAFQGMFSSGPLAGAGVAVPPLKRLGTASIDGVAGEMFGSNIDSERGHATIEVTFIMLDAQHVGIQWVLKSNPPAPREAQALDQLLSSVKIVLATAPSNAPPWPAAG